MSNEYDEEAPSMNEPLSSSDQYNLAKKSKTTEDCIKTGDLGNRTMTNDEDEIGAVARSIKDSKNEMEIRNQKSAESLPATGLDNESHHILILQTAQRRLEEMEHHFMERLQVHIADAQSKIEFGTLDSLETKPVKEDSSDEHPSVEFDVVPERYDNSSPIQANLSGRTGIASPGPTSSPQLSQNPLPRRFASRVPNASEKYPRDCYSFIALYGHERDKPWTRHRFLCFLFGLLPFLFQMLLLGLLAFSQTNALRGTIGETDNPDQDKQEFMALFAKFIPANSTPTVRWAQVASLAAYVIFPSSSLHDIVRSVQLVPHCTKEGSNPSLWLGLSCFLRATQGITAMIVTLLLVLKSITVVDIILNFTAVNFISGLDEDAFFLAITGDFSPAMKVEAERVAATDLPPCIFKKHESRWKCYQLMAGLVYLFLLGVVTFIFASQDSNKVWVTKLLRVQFQDSTGLNQYSGCFDMNTASSSVKFSRRTYHSLDTGSLNTTFGYCREDRQWILVKGNTTDPCQAEEGLLLASSAKTDMFDISAMFEESWVSGSNTPLELYFFDGENETAISKHCDLSLGDGKCDNVFNELGYDFDGGDCCAATCTKSNCGRGGLKSVFGNSEVSGDGYEDCVDPNMFPITIHLNNMESSRIPKYTGWKELNDTKMNWWCNRNEWAGDENEFMKWMEADPIKTYFSLDCNGKNVMTAYVDDTMINQSQTVLVEDGAYCSLVVRNATTALCVFDDDPILYIDYTISHDGAFVNDNLTKSIEILSSQSSEVETMNFTKIPECYFRKLGDHVEIDSIYTGNSSSNQAINWLLEDPDPKQQCEDSNFLERYALVNMNFALNPTKPFIAATEQCRWPSISCNEGTIVSIQLIEQGLKGNVPSEIGFISNLISLLLDNNKIESLPTDIGNLKSLQSLSLRENILESIPTEIGNLANLQELHLDENWVTSLPSQISNLLSLRELNLDNNVLESVPTEIGDLSSLQRLDLDDNLLTSLPTQIGKLKSLQYLWCGGIYAPYRNQLTSLPSEIGNLSILKELNLNRNQLKLLPPEFGNLTSLQSLALEDNQFASLPTEIGNLSSLQRLDLDSNRLKSLPTEFGALKSLLELNLHYNSLRSLPSQLGNMSSLQTLQLYNNQLASLPTEIGDLSSLQTLKLMENKIASLPSQVGNLSSLQELSLNSNALTSVPSEIGNLSRLEELDLYTNALASLPTEIGNLSSLECLYFGNNMFTSIPTEIGNLSRLWDLSLANNELESVPTEIWDLSSLVILHLDNNKLTSLPTEIGKLARLEELWLDGNELTTIPPEIGNLSSLWELSLDASQLSSLPSKIGNLSKLEHLYLRENRLISLPAEIGDLASLRNLHLEDNQLKSLSTQIGNLSSLEYLYLPNNLLQSLPTEIGNLSSLQNLELNSNTLASLPTQIGSLSSLETLYLHNNQLTSLQTEIGNLSNLQELWSNYNNLTFVPTEIGNLIHLWKLNLNFNNLTFVPKEIGNLAGLRDLDLEGNKLVSLPSQVGHLSSLQDLHLRGNQLTSVPMEIGNLSSLEYLDLDNNQLTSLPTEIGNLSLLKRLWFKYNELISLPTEIGNLSSLQKLDLWGNQLTSVPSEIGNLLSLEYLDLDGNQLTSLPTEIGNLSLLRLVWFNNNELTSIPSQIGNLSNLQQLYYDANVELPEEVLWLCSTIECGSFTFGTSTISPSEI